MSTDAERDDATTYSCLPCEYLSCRNFFLVPSLHVYRLSSPIFRNFTCSTVYCAILWLRMPEPRNLYPIAEAQHLGYKTSNPALIAPSTCRYPLYYLIIA
jgi:hypothetical protein